MDKFIEAVSISQKRTLIPISAVIAVIEEFDGVWLATRRGRTGKYYFGLKVVGTFDEVKSILNGSESI